MTDTSFAELDSKFIKNLNYHLYNKSPAIYALRRSFGRNLTDSVPVYMAFSTVAGEPIPKKLEPVYFLIACMFYKTRSLNSDPNKEYKTVSFETLVSRVYQESNSTKATIKRFLEMKYDDKGVFTKQFVRICTRCLKTLKANEQINYSSLLNDLKFWNSDKRTTQYKWARAITHIDIKEETK